MLRKNFESVNTIVKFYQNPIRDRPDNEVITRTLLKIGVVDSKWKAVNDQETWPQDGEHWRVEVTDEINPGESKGCFILVPLEQIETDTITPILPGMYSEELHDQLLLLKPHDNKVHWILPIKLRRVIRKKAYAAVICVA